MNTTVVQSERGGPIRDLQKLEGPFRKTVKLAATRHIPRKHGERIKGGELLRILMPNIILFQRPLKHLYETALKLRRMPRGLSIIKNPSNFIKNNSSSTLTPTF
jgi:hypothetical protein